MSQSFNLRVLRWFAEHAGVGSRAELVALGLRPSAIDMRVARGALEVVFPGVYRPAFTRLSAYGWRRAALLACGEHSHLSHETAATQIEMWQSRRLEVIVPPDVNLTIPGIRIRRCIVEEADSTVVDGLRCTSWSRTILDCCTTVGIKGIRTMLDRTVEPLQIFDVRQMEDLLERHPRRAGRKRLRQTLGWVTDSGDQSRSVEERLVDHALRDLGITGYEPNGRLLRFFGDFVFRDEHLNFEIDGGQHRAPFAQLYDRERDAEIERELGVRTRRFSTADVRADPLAVAQAIATDVAQAQAQAQAARSQD